MAKVLIDWCMDNKSDVQIAEQGVGLLDRTNLQLRVRWVNALRVIVGSSMPKNKSGCPMVSDIDLILSSDEERFAALKKIK
jgi:hypothetical protein